MNARGNAGRFLVGLTCAFLIAGCGAGTTAPTPAASPARSAVVATPTTIPTVTPAPASSSPSLAEDLQAALERMVETQRYPAVSAAVVLPDGTSSAGAAGMSDAAARTPATPDTSFVVGSITKTYIAALMLELAHDGVLTLDDPLATWLPELNGDARFTIDKVTIRQLLGHTSGIANYTGEAYLVDVLKDPSRRWTPDEVLGWVGAPLFAPGTDFEYVNTNYILAGMVIERATGSTVASLLRQRFLVPLGLDRTALQPQELPVAPTAHGYSEVLPGGRDGSPVDGWDDSGLMPSASIASTAWTAGGLTASAPDLARWAAALYGGRVLDAASLDDMLDFDRDAAFTEGGYGLGVAKGYDDRTPAVGHSGGVPGFRAEMWYLTEAHATIVVLANTDSASFTDAYLSVQRLVVEHLGP